MWSYTGTRAPYTGMHLAHRQTHRQAHTRTHKLIDILTSVKLSTDTRSRWYPKYRWPQVTPIAHHSARITIIDYLRYRQSQKSQSTYRTIVCFPDLSIYRHLTLNTLINTSFLTQPTVSKPRDYFLAQRNKTHLHEAHQHVILAILRLESWE